MKNHINEPIKIPNTNKPIISKKLRNSNKKDNDLSNNNRQRSANNDGKIREHNNDGIKPNLTGLSLCPSSINFRCEKDTPAITPGIDTPQNIQIQLHSRSESI